MPAARRSDPGDLAASGAMQKLSRISLRSAAARVLRAQIVSGTLQPDRLYAIGEVAAQLGTSPTPVREALLDLSSQGLVELVRNRGFRVREMTDHDLDELVHIRTLLEVPAVEQLASLRPAPDLADVQDLCVRIEKAASEGDLDGFLVVDRDLHLQLIAKLGNGRLVDLVGNFRDQTRLYGLGHLVGTPRMTASAHEHTEILGAIAAGRSEQAGALMRAHLGHVRRDWSATRPQA
jgi:DNA-binding GntR family transcriptional regulator